MIKKIKIPAKSKENALKAVAANYLFNKNTGTGDLATTNSNGELSVTVYEGYNYLNLRLPDSQANQFVNTSIYIVVSNGVITSVKKFTGAQIEVINEVYQIALLTPNVIGKLSINGLGTDRKSTRLNSSH